jgi:hypothetical protein
MDWAGWLTFGFVATVALTAVMVGAQMAGLTRMDLPFLLGSAWVRDQDRARLVGLFLHLGIGQFFALFYASAFHLMHLSAWWLGGLFGAFHGVAALTVLVPFLPGIHPWMASDRSGPELPVLEPPGLFCLNYGRETAVATLAGHVMYGVILGLFLHP